jgi:hypothetical protein
MLARRRQPEEPMAFTLGVFDVFGSAIPGAAYLSVLAYVLTRLGWTRPLDALAENTTVGLVSVAVMSYVLGMATYGLARSLSRAVSRVDYHATAFEAFRTTFPWAAGRSFLTVDAFLLETRIELESRESAVEISRLRAGGTMLRGLVIPSLLAAAVGLVDFAIAPHESWTLVIAGLFSGFAVLAHIRSLEMLRWAVSRTLELAFWLPEIDQAIDRRPPTNPPTNPLTIPPTNPTNPPNPPPGRP